MEVQNAQLQPLRPLHLLLRLSRQLVLEQLPMLRKQGPLLVQVVSCPLKTIGFAECSHSSCVY